jgi:hypothetical protein
MSAPRLRDPLRRPAFRRLAFSYGVNELGDWLGIIALSVLVFEQTESALATALLFLGTGFLPALLTPVVVARLERPPPRFVLPTIYAGEAAAFGALALLADNFSLAAVVAVATIDGALALTARALTRAVSAAMLEPEGELRAGRPPSSSTPSPSTRLPGSCSARANFRTSSPNRGECANRCGPGSATSARTGSSADCWGRRPLPSSSSRR